MYLLQSLLVQTMEAVIAVFAFGGFAWGVLILLKRKVGVKRGFHDIERSSS